MVSEIRKPGLQEVENWLFAMSGPSVRHRPCLEREKFQQAG